MIFCHHFAHTKVNDQRNLAESLQFTLRPCSRQRLQAALSAAAYFLGLKLFPGRQEEYEAAPDSGDAEVNRQITEGREAMGETVVRLRADGKIYSGRGISTDIIGSSIRAYISAVNKIVYEEGE